MGKKGISLPIFLRSLPNEIINVEKYQLIMNEGISGFFLARLNKWDQKEAFLRGGSKWLSNVPFQYP